MAAERDPSSTPALDVTFLQEISLPAWRLLFDHAGYPAGLSPSRLTHAAIEGALTSSGVSGQILDALQTAYDLGTEPGRDAILDAARDQGIDTTSWPGAETPRDMAIRLFVAQRGDPRVEQAITRAQMKVQETRPLRTYREYVGTSARRVTDIKRRVGEIKADVATFCLTNGMGDHIEVRAVTDDDMVSFQIVHGSRMLSLVEVASHGRKHKELRLAQCDVIRYDGASGRLSLSVRVARMVDFYRLVFGRALFGDAAFFSGDAVYTLEPLKRGPDALRPPAHVQGVAGARLREVQWRVGDDQFTLKGPDCFATLRQKQENLGEAALATATLDLDLVVGKRPKRKRVTIKVPNRAEYHRDLDETVVEKYLSSIGLRAAAPPETAADLWSLYPWHHRLSRWREALGSGVDAWVRDRILVGRPLHLVSVPENPRAAVALEAIPLDDNTYYGVSNDEAIPSRTLTPTDVEAYELDPVRLAERISSALGLEDGVRDLGQRILFNLGRRRFDGFCVRVFLLMREPVAPEDTIARINAAAGSDGVAVLRPPGRDGRTGRPEIALPPCGPYEPLFADIVDGLGLRDNVPAIALAPADARLVVDRRLRLAWLDGLELKKLGGGTQPYRFIEILADARGGWVDKGDLWEKLSKANNNEAYVRQVKAEALGAIRASFKEARRSGPKDLKGLFRSSGGSWRVDFKSFAP